MNSRSESPTPKNSPQNNRHQNPNLILEDPQSQSATLRQPLNHSLPPSAHSTLTRLQISQVTLLNHFRSTLFSCVLNLQT
jgi:hypothetical protein